MCLLYGAVVWAAMVIMLTSPIMLCPLLKWFQERLRKRDVFLELIFMKYIIMFLNVLVGFLMKIQPALFSNIPF
ncbi:MAG: hypothetical protein A2509_08120 [Candidatus Edwardsbacteria bacterium RIFOXYD12_FULL_50_11]|uniref:Uncharacterized protein n=1 Tax=Candidatus Edwardsbacteria bacterium GWF2_54_11 TaxID=1817851 RepID=A0A1F5QY66_9BACT|nr:MAG: hypothetical protein A2502_11995 [Candidatus Edwardsbacteria bacterium RifOxyC12_full_54_24]OGF06634.1 MAG: hypothetical protein A2273_12160 [Candidatus Edwardsbacteria bacterium RifOxyA12_full_54_48]OGF07156.1 MAG: hypothetical protein A2024_05220 [Candidatus Edwardsbacteria bacterium GWF2_54_11]OGF11663.1 MAG: hypothetical protein A3K15_04930 [Candidatus Edwardsbacteria bacterium GWE2_54_12]OGF17951.1 MAG: hypothetical protein A2509_08120 [Candidatus Edwardsbacteria bacterium RIFOXYD1